MIDRITQASLKDFTSKFDLSHIQDETVKFEHFVNYTILEKKLEDRLDEDSLEKIHIGVNDTFGLDDFCILINKHLITSKEELSEILSKNVKPNAEVFFIQAKISNSFEVKEISSFGDAVEDFVSVSQKYKWSQNAIISIELFNQIPSIDILNITEGIGMAIIDPAVKAEEMYIGNGTTIAWKLM